MATETQPASPRFVPMVGARTLAGFALAALTLVLVLAAAGWHLWAMQQNLEAVADQMPEPRQREMEDALGAVRSAHGSSLASVVGVGVLALGAQVLWLVLVAREGRERLRLAQMLDRQREGLAEAATRLQQAADKDAILAVLVQEARRTIGADRAVAVLRGPRGQRRRAASMAAGRELPAMLEDRSGLDRLVCDKNRSLRLTRAELAARSLSSPSDDPAALLRGWLAAPLVDRSGQNMGLVQLSDRVEGEFTQEDEWMLVQLAQMASAAVENARLNRQLRESDQRKDEFLAILGHELRNPLAGIVTGVEVLSSLPATPDQAEMQGVIARQARHMQRMVDDLLDVSRIVNGKLTLRLETMNLADIVRNAVADYRRSHQIESCEISTIVPDDAVWVSADSTRIAQIIVNLLHNACKFCDGPNRVDVELRVDAERHKARLMVRDAGLGMSDETLRRIFEPFTQADNTLQRRRGGLGLGLAVVRGLVSLHGGTIEAASAGLGKGSSFTVSLPLTEAPQAVEIPAVSPPAAPRRVLIIDDRRDAILPLEKMLSAEGHLVRSATEGPEGVAVLDEFPADCVFCDIGLAGAMTGHDVAREIRRRPDGSRLYLVAVTGYGQDEDRRQAAEAGFDVHLTKPVSKRDLQRVLRDVPQSA